MNPLILLGDDPEVFSDEEMVGCIWLNKDEFDVWFNNWINLKRMNYWFKFIFIHLKTRFPCVAESHTDIIGWLSVFFSCCSLRHNIALLKHILWY